MQGEISYEDVLPTLARKLHFAADLPEPARRSIAALQITPESPKVLRAFVAAVQVRLRTPSQASPQALFKAIQGTQFPFKAPHKLPL